MISNLNKQELSAFETDPIISKKWKRPPLSSSSASDYIDNFVKKKARPEKLIFWIQLLKKSTAHLWDHALPRAGHAGCPALAGFSLGKADLHVGP